MLQRLDANTITMAEALTALANKAGLLPNAPESGTAAAAAVAATGTRAAAPARVEPWLVIGIPTVPRRAGSIDYLTPTLDAIIAELPSDPSDPYFGRILVAIVNNAAPGNAHASFETNRARIGKLPVANAFAFISDHARTPVDATEAAATDAGSADHPGAKVRKQSRDVASVLRAVGARGSYYMFMEDDFSICPHGLAAIRYMIEQATAAHGDFISVRMSYGLSGIIMHSRDVETFAAYLVEHQARRPPDHLFAEWSGKETPQARSYIGTRVNAVFRYNLLDHLGMVSSLRESAQVTWPRCYEDLVYPTLFHVEAFDPQACPETDLWPCTPGAPPRPLIAWHMLRGMARATK